MITHLSNNSNIRNVMNLNSQEIDTILSVIHPIGSIYKSVDSTNPSTLFPNTTWQQIQGRFLLAADNVNYHSGDIGGEETVTLTTNQLPTHAHNATHQHILNAYTNMTASSSGNHNHVIASGVAPYNKNVRYRVKTTKRTNYASNSTAYNMLKAESGVNPPYSTNATDLSHTHDIDPIETTTSSASGTTGSTGSGQAHNNMPPYLVVYMWKRTA